MLKYKTVAFDLDGTLTDPAQGLTSGFAYALGKMNVDFGEKSNLLRFIGPPLFDEFRKVYGMSPEEADETIRLFREYFSVYGWWDNKLYEGIPELLSNLKSAGLKLVLATSKPEIFAKKILRLFDIEKYFDFVGGASLDKTRVEKSQVLEYALKAVGAEKPEDCVLVGDRKYDAEGAHLCGIDSIGVLYGHGSREEIEDSNFTFIAETVEKIEKLLLNCF